jgi:molybdopterin-containing oxidoreductase family iron-sulfur binding subunit
MVPYVRAPEGVVPGQPLFYATAMPLDGYGIGLLAEQIDGRPIKLEGNPRHPASLGATDIFAQGSILVMYDPDRSQFPVTGGSKSDWNAFLAALAPALDAARGNGGAGLRLLTGTVTSPSLAAQIAALRQAFPQMTWHQYDPASGDGARLGNQQAFGAPVDAVYRFDQARVVVSLEADFMGHGPGKVRYARDFMSRRQIAAGQEPGELNRLYAAESAISITGAKAEHHLRAQSGQIEGIARALAAAVGVAGAAGEAPEAAARWVAAAAADLQAAGANALVVPGEFQPPAVHALAHAINQQLGAVGTTVNFIDPVAVYPDAAQALDRTASLRDLAGAMNGNQVQALVMIGVNPVYTAPADLDFATALGKVQTSIHLGVYNDETGRRSTWHIPEAYYLETWGDVRAFDGTTSLIQPLIAPLYAGKSPHELLAALLGQPNATAYDLVRAFWRGAAAAADVATDDAAFETYWNTALYDGFVANSAPQPRADLTVQAAALGAAPAAAAQGLEVVFRPDPTVHDGFFANVSWLQELPKPNTLVTWDNMANLSPATAQRLGVTQNDVVEVVFQGRTVRAPVWVTPGQADETVVLQLGYGRTAAGQVAGGINWDLFRQREWDVEERGLGYNAYSVRPSANPWFGGGAEVRGTGEIYKLASTQIHYTMPDERPIVMAADLEEYESEPNFAREKSHTEDHHPSVLPPYTDYKSFPRWAMTIDLNTCIGCNACTIACQAENNIPVVGKEQVLEGREMHWIRVDQYYFGDLDDPQIYHMPVPCMHCEQAPCEIVCPVAATVHDHEGLNNMVYNRCVGTRYCSNNCPYKVRRYNFLQWTDLKTPVLALQRNPDVTVRNRGVMEKCSYCIQRINETRISVQNRGGSSNDIPDGMVQTACQQVCPTRAITFGDWNKPEGAVTKLKASPLNYNLLDELNTKPRTSYLAKVWNPNPALGEAREGE